MTHFKEHFLIKHSRIIILTRLLSRVLRKIVSYSHSNNNSTIHVFQVTLPTCENGKTKGLFSHISKLGPKKTCNGYADITLKGHTGLLLRVVDFVSMSMVFLFQEFECLLRFYP